MAALRRHGAWQSFFVLMRMQETAVVFGRTYDKKELALETVARLKKEYPDAGCTLEYEDAWKLLISVRLAAQCTDARVNQVVPGLYEKFPTISALADADESDIEEIVRPCGLGKSKARDIKACMTMLRVSMTARYQMILISC